MSPEVIDALWKAGIGLLVAVILYSIKDYRRTRIENELASETVEPRARKANIEQLDAQILAMSKAWDEERASKDRRIADLEKQFEEASTKLTSAEGTISELRRQAETMRRQIDNFQAKLVRMENMLSPKEGTT